MKPTARDCGDPRRHARPTRCRIGARHRPGEQVAGEHEVHVQQVVRGRMGEREGIGVLEQLCLGPHAPSGFTEFLDGAR